METAASSHAAQTGLLLNVLQLHARVESGTIEQQAADERILGLQFARKLEGL